MFNWLQGAIVAVVVGGLALAAHKVDMFFVEKKHALELKTQSEKLVARCEAEKKITEEVSNELQSKVSSLDARLASIKRLRPDACLSVLADPARKHDDAAHNAGLPRQNGEVSSAALFDFARDAEEVGLRLDACQGFVKKTWTLAHGKKGQ